MARNELVILDPRSQPVRGLISAHDQASLGPGEWAQLDNVRLEKGLLSCRGGMTASLGTICEAAEFRGIWTGPLWEESCVVVAVEVDDEVRVYRSTNMTAWTELTAASGAYGNTRFSTDGGVVRFTVASSPYGELLLAANGADAVRGFSETGGASIADVAAPLQVQEKTVYIGSVAYFADFQAPITETDSGGGMSFAVTGSTPDVVADLTIGTATAQDDSATLQFTMTGVTATEFDRQLLIGVDTAYGPLWDKLKVELGSSTVWDGATPGGYARPYSVSVDGTSKAIWVFQFPKVSATSNVSNLKLTWSADDSEAPAADATARFFLIGLGFGGNGKLPYKADTSVAITSMNSQTLTESPGVIYSTYATQRLKDIGGPVLNELRLPRSELLDCVISAPYVNVSDDELDAGVDSVVFYTKETGQSKYRFAGRRSVTDYSGSWAYLDGAEGDVIWTFVLDDNGQAFEEYLPDAFNMAIPTGATEVCTANNRLFVGKSGSGNLVISQYKNGFRCRQFVTFEEGAVLEDSPTQLDLPGETVRGIVPIAASTVGSSTVFIFTDRNVYATQGQTTTQLSQLGRVANLGIQSPMATVADKGDLYFLDQEMQVRVLAGGSMQSITRQIIDDQLLAIPGDRRQWVCAAFSRDRYYLAFTPSGGDSNTRVAVFDARQRVWTTDTPALPLEGLASWFDGSAKSLRLVGIGEDFGDLKGYEYDVAGQSQDLGTDDIPCTLEPYELHSPDGGLFHVGRCRAMIDDSDGSVASVMRTYHPSVVSQTTSLSLDTSQEHIYREDRIEGATVTGSGQPVGPRCRVVWSLPLRSGRMVRFLSLEFTPLGGGHDRP